MDPARIEILLATYNGEKYITELLRSILDQTVDSWRILARDNGSSDRTLEILKEHEEAHPDKFRIIRDDLGNIGACGNFARLLELSTAPYIMFCDCDDVWLPNKIEVTLRKMREMEAGSPADTPCLVHTDLRVVDSDLNLICESFWKYQHIFPEASTLNRLLMMNVVTGCTVMINRPLSRRGEQIPPAAIMHDWWLSLIAAAFGTIGYVREPTILYRQHSANDTGAKRWDWRLSLKRAIREELSMTFAQAQAFLDIHGRDVDTQTLSMLKACASIGDSGFLRKRLNLIKFRLLMCGVVRNVGLHLIV